LYDIETDIGEDTYVIVMVNLYRYGRYYSEAGVEKRDLVKAYGIRYIIKVTGRAGKFSIVPLLLNIGSGIGLLAIVSIDVILPHTHADVK
jgi:hypothetical protein